MCMSCNCLRHSDDHGDPRHIVLADLLDAALAAGLSPAEAAESIARTAHLVTPDDIFAARFDRPKAKKKTKRRG